MAGPTSTIFCCLSIRPWRPRRLDHEAKFDAFMQWANLQTTSLVLEDVSSLISSAPYAIQLVRQVNYGPQESIRYFISASSGFAEATEDNLIQSNFDKVNSYKNYRCEKHNKFFEINLYQKNPTNTHHWRATLARPSREIDLVYRRKENEVVAKASNQEGKDERVSSEREDKTSFEPNVSQTLKKPVQAPLKQLQPVTEPDLAALTRVLRFLLPRAGTNLGSSRLLSLLSLEFANEELRLGVDFEIFWKAELTSSNISTFIYECFPGHVPQPIEVHFADVEDLVIPAMSYIYSRSIQQVPGKSKLHEIVNRVLDSGRTLDWVVLYRGIIASVFTSGPSEELLERCQQKHESLQQGPSGFSTDVIQELQLGKDEVEFTSGLHQDQYNDYDRYDFNNDYDDEHEPMKDFAACDKECGYCGNCDY